VFSKSAIVADSADATCQFHPATRPSYDTTSSISSYREFAPGADPFDFTVYMDHVRITLWMGQRSWTLLPVCLLQAPLCVSIHAPLELVQQFFVKLGARYVIVTNNAGFCESHLPQRERARRFTPRTQLRVSSIRKVGSHSLKSWRSHRR